MRVASYNLLHGVPLRDRVGSNRSEDKPSVATVGYPGAPSGMEAGVGELDLTEAASPHAALGDVPPADPNDPERTAASAANNGLSPSDRHLWSPEVSDPADLLRSVEELLESGPIDVIALQEVDRWQPRTSGVDQAGLIAEMIGAKYWRFVSSVRGTPGIAAEGAAWVPATSADDLPTDEGEPESPVPSGPRYGVALISRYPVRGWRVKRFPPAPVSMPLLAPTEDGRPKAIRVPDEPRSAVAGIVELPHTDLTFATAHLSFVPGVNTKQLNNLRAFVAGMPRPMVLMGDFNTPGGIPGLVTGWEQVARVPTYPVMRPRVQFDHIMADGWTDEAMDEARASARAVPLPVSDHCALIADFPEP
ncbi:MAG: endonuclease/exonuclease/phosphatase family protein [Actinomycetota bacterium]|nr:endonuclease/exonuclease/phosphatase family protein [Actinomycetota bacterium]